MYRSYISICEFTVGQKTMSLREVKPFSAVWIIVILSWDVLIFSLYLCDLAVKTRELWSTWLMTLLDLRYWNSMELLMSKCTYFPLSEKWLVCLFKWHTRKALTPKWSWRKSNQILSGMKILLLSIVLNVFIGIWVTEVCERFNILHLEPYFRCMYCLLSSSLYNSFKANSLYEMNCITVLIFCNMMTSSHFLL